MTVDDDYWKNIPEPTIGRRIIVYFRVALFPILIICVIYELIDLKISFGKFNGIGVDEKELNNFRKRHPISKYIYIVYIVCIFEPVELCFFL